MVPICFCSIYVTRQSRPTPIAPNVSEVWFSAVFLLTVVAVYTLQIVVYMGCDWRDIFHNANRAGRDWRERGAINRAARLACNIYIICCVMLYISYAYATAVVVLCYAYVIIVLCCAVLCTCSAVQCSVGSPESTSAAGCSALLCGVVRCCALLWA